MTYLAYGLAPLIGFVMGLMGGGGAILAVPVLLYLLGFSDIDEVTSYVIIIVGIGATAGAISHARKGNVKLNMAWQITLPILLATYLTRMYLLDLLPDPLLQLPAFSLSKRQAILGLLALLLGVSAYLMIRPTQEVWEKKGIPSTNKPWLLLPLGLFIGLISGLTGTGGGFMLVPILLLVLRVPMKSAIGTTLAILALKSYAGMLGDWQAGRTYDLIFLFSFSGLLVLGVALGSYATHFIPAHKLKRAFGYFILLLTLLVMVREIGGA
jgi:uncharacterized membrane protein YfcA